MAETKAFVGYAFDDERNRRRRANPVLVKTAEQLEDKGIIWLCEENK